MSIFPKSLRYRLVLLVLLAVVPSIGHILYSGYEQRRLARIRAQEQALNLADLVSMETGQVIQMTRELVDALAQSSSVVDSDPETCSRTLASLKKILPFCQAVMVAHPNGRLICASQSGHSPIDLSDRDYFRRAVKTRELAISGFLIGRLTGRPSVGFAYPSIDEAGQVKAVVVATLDLSWLVKGVSTARLPSGSVLNIIDAHGTVLARWPNPEQWVGRQVPEAEIVKQVLVGKEGVFEGIGMERIPRLYGFKPLMSGQQAGFVYVGILQSLAYGPANRMLASNLIGLGIVTLLGLGAALFFGHVFIMRSVTSLVDTTKRLASGDLSARTGISPGGGEIAQLSMAFDEMADALQRREEERKLAEQEIRANAARAHLLANISEEFIKAGLDYGAALSATARYITEWSGDICLINLLTVDGDSPGAPVVCHSDPARLSFIRDLFSSSESPEQELLQQVVDTRKPMVIPSAHDEPTSSVNLERLQCRSLVIVAMRADDQIIGTLALIRERAGNPYTADDESFLQYVADRAAISVANARLVETIQQLNAELEQRVQKRTVQLEAANKELEAFAYSVSHDLRAPLRAVDGFSRIVLDRYTTMLDETGQDYLQRVRSGAQRMGQLIDDLLKLSRLTRTDMRHEKVDLSKLAHEIEVELKESQPDRSVEFIVAKDLAVVGDERLLRSALENLLGNAWKFTQLTPNPRIEIGVKCLDSDQIFFVSDNGAGFDMAYADQLFGAFQRLHSMSEFPGTGIGLAIVQRVLHRHGASVWAEGAVGQGATFYFKFPNGG